jgi:hypothetical protein
MSKAVQSDFRSIPLNSRTIPSPLTLIIALLLICSTLASPTIAATDAPELSAEAATASEGPATAYYRWIDGDGRIQYTDFEPVGVPAERIALDLEADDADAPVLSNAAQDRPSDPFHDQDQQILPIEHIGPCADARRQLAILHATLPVYIDESGEHRNAWRGDTYRGGRHYLDAEARTAAVAAVRGTVLEHCSDPDAFAREEAAFKEMSEN